MVNLNVTNCGVSNSASGSRLNFLASGTRHKGVSVRVDERASLPKLPTLFLHISAILVCCLITISSIRYMATSNLLTTQFDDSEDEDDNFNPAPADLSDDDNAGDDDESEAQMRSEGARRRVADGTYDDGDDEEAPPAKANGKSKTLDRREVNPADEDGEDEGEGEDLNGEAGDEEDEEEEDDDEEEVTVCWASESFIDITPKHHFSNCYDASSNQRLLD